ncbi:MAG: CRISPR-associated protein Cas5, partial [Oscillospiraceae bacterium]
MNPRAVIEIWGDFALWSRPECKVERLTYPVPTPSGIRGVLASIYAKPDEFYWQVCSIEVLKPIRYITFRRNEVKSKAARVSDAAPFKSCICVEDDRTQRQSVVLQDVRYRITAEIVPRPDFPYPPARLINQFERRVDKGQCFMQP